MVNKTPPTPPTIRYDLLVEESLRSVVRKVLLDIAKDGLQGDHHFFITFSTFIFGDFLCNDASAVEYRECIFL